jgi:hypothetical protein
VFCEFQVGGLIILHRNRFSIFGQGRYGGPYRGFDGIFYGMWAHMRGRFSGRRASVRACPLNMHAWVREKVVTTFQRRWHGYGSRCRR